MQICTRLLILNRYTMEHQFCIELASCYGIEEAIIIHKLYFWIKKNVANGNNFHDGRYWTYNSSKAFSILFPYMTESKIYRVLKSLEEKGLIVKGNYNDTKYDRTTWYSLSDKAIKELYALKYDTNGFSESVLQNNEKDFAKMQNGNNESEKPIPYSKQTDSNTDGKQEEKKEWRDSFEVYLALINKAKENILADSEFRQYIERYYPNADYEATLNKLIDGFWGKAEGWEYCKSKRKGKTINMTSALKKNMDKRERIVYKSKQSQNKSVSSQPTKVPLHPDLKIIDEEGTLNDGTFVKNGYRYYFSKQQGQAFSIPPSAEPMPQDVDVEYDYKFGWYEC